MGEFSDSLQGTATDLITQFGESVRLHFQATDTMAIVSGFPEEYLPDQLTEFVSAGDVRLLISSNVLGGNTIQPDDRVVFADNKIFYVVSVDDTRAQGDSIILAVQCRQVKFRPTPNPDRTEDAQRI